MKKFLVIFTLFLGFLGLLGLGGAGFYWWTSPTGSRSEKVEFDVPEGAGFSSVTDKLAKDDLLRWPLAFKLYLKMVGDGPILKEGTYELNRGMTPKEIFDKLVKGQVKLISFSFPEGWNMWQVAEKLATVFPHISVLQWKAAMEDPKYLTGLPKEAITLEGYLFPETYTIRPKATLAEVISTMTTTWKRNITDELIAQGKTFGLSLHEVMTLASIVEKETGQAEERPRISGVFHNRMRKKMKLQTDPTVIYGIWERYDGNIRKKDLSIPTPYNTYVINGLPPGPIANPGLESIKAAVNPAATDDIYFVGKGDGTHFFSKSLQEHNKAVYEFQVKPTRKRTK